jgi:hypothetical protein
MQYINGERYEGYWKDDKADGKGTLTYLQGDKYVGDWVAAKKQGQGELYYANGDMFRGEWLQVRQARTRLMWAGRWAQGFAASVLGHDAQRQVAAPAGPRVRERGADVREQQPV